MGNKIGPVWYKRIRHPSYSFDFLISVFFYSYVYVWIISPWIGVVEDGNATQKEKNYPADTDVDDNSSSFSLLEFTNGIVKFSIKKKISI